MYALSVDEINGFPHLGTILFTTFETAVCRISYIQIAAERATPNMTTIPKFQMLDENEWRILRFFMNIHTNVFSDQ